MLKKVIKVITNKYFITGLVFVLWCAFFDQNDWFTIREKQKNLNELKSSIRFMNAEISHMENERRTLSDTTDRRQLERYARENFRMKRDNEDVYVVDGGN